MSEELAFREGKLYEARVVAVNVSDGLVDVELLSSGQTIPGARCVAPFHSTMLGIRSRVLPSTGTNVLVMKGGSAVWIIGPVVSANYAGHDQGTRATSRSEDHAREDTKTDAALRGDKNPTRAIGDGWGTLDMLEGEVTAESVLGCGIDLLQGLAALKGGDLARVEACFYNSMVRIISDTYKNLSAFGDFVIYRDGNRLNVRWNGTSYDHEAYGQESEGAPRLDKTKTGYEMSDEAVSVDDTGRWRFSMFVGHLGDFFNMFYHDPVRTLGKLASRSVDQKAKSGKFRMNVGPEGQFLVQSTDSLIFERVTRIVVPVETHKPDNPEGTRADDMEAFNKDPLKVWSYGDDMYDACFQLRLQARWLANYHNLARFWQDYEAEKGADWKVPEDENDIDPPRMDNAEKDRQVNSAVKFVETYSTIRMMADGSILFWDGYGSSVLMGQGDIRLNATRNLFLGAAGTVAVDAGQDFRVAARRSVEITGAKGSCMLRGAAWATLVSDHGTVWLRSDADPNGDVNKDGMYVDGDAENSKVRIVNNKGVIIQAEKAGAALDAQHHVHMRIGAAANADAAPGFRVRCDSADAEVHLWGNGTTYIGGRHVAVRTMGDFVVTGPRSYFSGAETFFGRSAAIRGGMLHAMSIQTNTIKAASVSTQYGNVGKFGKDEKVDPAVISKEDSDNTETSLDDQPLPATPGLLLRKQALPGYVNAEGGSRIGYDDSTLSVTLSAQYQSLAEQFIESAEELTERYTDYDPRQRLNVARVLNPLPMDSAEFKKAAQEGTRLDKPGRTPQVPKAQPLKTVAKRLKALKQAFLSQPVFKRTPQ